MSIEAHKRLIIDVDYSPWHIIDWIIKNVGAQVSAIRIGLVQSVLLDTDKFISYAAKHGVNTLVSYNWNDVPATVAKASAAIVNIPGVSMFTVSCMGGSEMMLATRQAVKDTQCAIQPKVIGAISVLDFNGMVDIGLLTDDASALQYHKVITHQARLAQDCGLDGVVVPLCHIGNIRHACGTDFIIISYAEDVYDIPPARIINDGADYVIVNARAIGVGSGKEVEWIQRIADEIASVL